MWATPELDGMGFLMEAPLSHVPDLRPGNLVPIDGLGDWRVRTMEDKGPAAGQEPGWTMVEMVLVAVTSRDRAGEN
jgi:hypothetical protein